MICGMCGHYNICPQCNGWICERCGGELKPAELEVKDGDGKG